MLPLHDVHIGTHPPSTDAMGSGHERRIWEALAMGEESLVRAANQVRCFDWQAAEQLQGQKHFLPFLTWFA